tara:strand:- start:896 stop:1315 length:420 start_codon:yes stop_codon:yes gene_type:complete
MNRIEMNVKTGKQTIVPYTTLEKAEWVVLKAVELAAEPARLKQVASDQAILEFEEETAAMTADYSQAEIDTFSTQEAEAAAYTADNQAPTPLLDAIISESEDTKADLVAAIIGNAASLKVGAGKAIGRKKKKVRVALGV